MGTVPRGRRVREALYTPSGPVRLFSLLTLFSLLPMGLAACQASGGDQEMIPLPAPRPDGPMSVEEAVEQRRSVRSFPGDALDLESLSQLLWAAQGVTQPSEEPPEGFRWEWMGGLRTAPSAGALYPLELYALVGSVESLSPGLYRYVPTAHALELVAGEDLRDALWGAALRQTAIREAPVTLVFAAVIARTAAKYGDRAERYVHIEVGSAAENVYLQVEPLGLGTVFMGAFDDAAVRDVLGLPGDQDVFGIMPVGRKGPG